MHTLISRIKKNNENPLKGITKLNNISMFKISGLGIKKIIGITSRIFLALSRVRVSTVLITQSFHKDCSISFCIPQNEQKIAHHILEEEFNIELKDGLLNPFNIIENLAIISLVINGTEYSSRITAKCFSVLELANINIIAIAQSASEYSLSLVINNNDVVRSIYLMHQISFNNNKIIQLFIIGVGGVGSTLLEQLHRQQYWMQQKHIDLHVCGIANSQMILTNEYGIDLNDWKTKLSKVKQIFNFKYLISFLKKHYLINPVIMDCTASQEVADQYINFIKNGFHVVTANKKANTSSWDYYQKIRITTAKYRRKFLYDTNVGAGLPVIENLQNLLNAGDKLIKFSGILSGSLSFIFGKLDEGISLSQATTMACELGFTEPDPRDDLSGIDIARKLLILARETGHQIELNDINIEPLIPEKLMQINNIDEFMKSLPELDQVFALRVNKAHNEGKVLRFVGIIEKNFTCKVKIAAVDSNDPFYKVKNGENALAFYSNYYQPLPLVLRGYGAGNEVTAAGLFADLLRTLS